MRGSLFPRFPWFVVTRVSQDAASKQESVRGSLFPLLPLRGKCQNERLPFPLFFGSIFPSCQDMDHQKRENRGTRNPLMVWHFIPRGNRDHLSVLKERRYVFRYVLTLFGHWVVHASDVMVAMDESMYD